MPRAIDQAARTRRSTKQPPAPEVAEELPAGGGLVVENPAEDCDCQIVHAQIVAGGPAGVCITSNRPTLSEGGLNSALGRHDLAIVAVLVAGLPREDRQRTIERRWSG